MREIVLHGGEKFIAAVGWGMNMREECLREIAREVVDLWSGGL